MTGPKVTVRLNINAAPSSANFLTHIPLQTCVKCRPMAWPGEEPE